MMVEKAENDELIRGLEVLADSTSRMAYVIFRSKLTEPMRTDGMMLQLQQERIKSPENELRKSKYFNAEKVSDVPNNKISKFN